MITLFKKFLSKIKTILDLVEDRGDGALDGVFRDSRNGFSIAVLKSKRSRIFGVNTNRDTIRNNGRLRDEDVHGIIIFWMQKFPCGLP